MLTKLSVRNMKRSARDYLVYIITLTLVSALMYGFHSLLFWKELKNALEAEDLMSTLLGFATVFIILIVAWLIHYMVGFILEKRSSEFGIYLLLGMKKQMIARLYMRENILLGVFCFLAGLAPGILFQQVLLSVLYTMVQMEYRLHPAPDGKTIFLSGLCYSGCFLLAFFRCGRRFRRMSIHGLMNAGRQGETVRERYEKGKQILLPISVLFLFWFWRRFERLAGNRQVAFFLIGLVATIYLFYMGLSAWIICYVRKRGNAVYRGQNLFLMRQFAFRIRTMQFTMGTLTALFTLALMGGSIALMLVEYENTVLKEKFPFDIQVYSREPEDDFAAERVLIEEETGAQEVYSYTIYTDGESEINTWMLTHLRDWGRIFYNAQGGPDREKIRNFLDVERVYYPFDTYMGFSDYARLRRLLGYGEVYLGEKEYLVQVKPRLEQEVQGIGEDLLLKDETGNRALVCAGICAEPFSQDGHNGADYLIIVPDPVLERMRPYYAELAAGTEGGQAPGLQREVEKVPDISTSDCQDPLDGLCSGSDSFMSFAAVCMVRADLIPRAKYMLASLIIPFFYTGLVFVCVAVTVLSVQQLSESVKYRFRYDVLTKLGVSRSQKHRLILKQLAACYLCPAFLAIIISGKMILYLHRRFVWITGVPVPVGSVFAKSIFLFFSVYLIYFVMVYAGFVRNTENSG